MPDLQPDSNKAADRWWSVTFLERSRLDIYILRSNCIAISRSASRQCFFFFVWIGDQKEEEEEKHQPKKKVVGSGVCTLRRWASFSTRDHWSIVVLTSWTCHGWTCQELRLTCTLPRHWWNRCFWEIASIYNSRSKRMHRDFPVARLLNFLFFRFSCLHRP